MYYLVVYDKPDITFALKTGLESKVILVNTFNDPKEALSNFVPQIRKLDDTD